jgi:hypothetical protein
MKKFTYIILLLSSLLNAIDIIEYKEPIKQIEYETLLLNRTQWINEISIEENTQVVLVLKKFTEYEITKNLKENNKNDIIKSLDYLAKETIKYNSIFKIITKNEKLIKLLNQEIIISEFYLNKSISGKDFYKRILEVEKTIKQIPTNRTNKLIAIKESDIYSTFKIIKKIKEEITVRKLNNKEITQFMKEVYNK